MSQLSLSRFVSVSQEVEPADVGLLPLPIEPQTDGEDVATAPVSFHLEFAYGAMKELKTKEIGLISLSN